MTLCFYKFLVHILQGNPDFSVRTWVSLVVDFSKAQLKGLTGTLHKWARERGGIFKEIMDELLDALLQGCLVHFAKNVERVMDTVFASVDRSQQSYHLAMALPAMPKKARTPQWKQIRRDFTKSAKSVKWWFALEVDNLLGHKFDAKTLAEWMASVRDSNAREPNQRPAK